MPKHQLNSKKKIRCVGIMNGTSLDGIDYVLIEGERQGAGVRCRLLDVKSTDFSNSLRSRLLYAAQGSALTKEISELNQLLGQKYATDLKKISSKFKWDFELVGLHGQTVFHSGGKSTLQLGDPSPLSFVLKVPVISNFRWADLAAGGQGAPLAPFFHQAVFCDSKTTLAVHNLGGISNLTLFRGQELITAFDTGPANMPLNELIEIATQGKKKFDHQGHLARKGQVDSKILAKALRHPFFNKKAPKSCGREEFGRRWILALVGHLSVENQLATATEIVALSIAKAYLKIARTEPSRIFFCGGGAKNIFLLERIAHHLPRTQISTTESLGWPSESIEGAAFAYLALLNFWDLSVVGSKVTGAKKSVVLGQRTELFRR